MTLIQRLVREPVLIIGVLVALFGVLVVFGVSLSEGQIGAIVTFAGAVMALLRFVTTPSNEVVAQKKPAAALPVAGKAAALPTGTPVSLSMSPVQRN